MLGSELLAASLEKRNLSYASRRLTLLPNITFNSLIEPAKKIIFLHPPKTGGTSVVYTADAIMKQIPSFKAIRFAVIRTPNQSPNLIQANYMGGFKSAENAFEIDAHCCDNVNFISGHFPFGLHALINSPCKYITLIRHPVERALSSTNFDFQRGYITEENATEYLLKAEIDNPQTRLLAGKDYMCGSCNEEVFERAKHNIEEHFLLVGITQETDTFIQILASIQSWGPVALVRSQVTANKAIRTLSPETEKQLVEKHAWDLKLYEWVKNRWNLWKKQHINPNKSLQSLSPDQKIPCITSDFSASHQPLFLTEKEIEQFNESFSEDAFAEVSQRHTKAITVEPKEKNLLPQFDATKIKQSPAPQDEKTTHECNNKIVLN